MTDHTPVSDTGERDSESALVAALIDLEHHVAEQGWDQPARLFALVETDALVAAEPTLAQQLGLRTTAEGAPPGALTAIEQEGFHTGEGLTEVMAQISWPETVTGCALALERNFLPARFEADIPDGIDEAERFVVNHPDRQELRVVAGSLREGEGYAVARLRSEPDELLGGRELVPGVVAACATTLLS